MPPHRKTRADGERTREAIVREAVSLATVDGLEGLSIGNLAGALDMSKSGIYAHFGSKQDLQLATVDEAGRIFEAEVIHPRSTPRPASRSSSRYATRSSTTSCGARSPAVASLPAPSSKWVPAPARSKNRSPSFRAGSARLIREFIVTALEQHELPADEDPDELTFEVNGIILAANANFVLRDDPATLRHGQEHRPSSTRDRDAAATTKGRRIAVPEKT